VYLQNSSGNFATVKLAINKNTGEPVAVKIIDKKKFALNPSLRKDQVLDEAKIMKAIHHPNILSIKDIIDSEDNIYMILELVTGGDLFDAVVAKGHYTEDEARDLFGQLASAVGYLHDIGIAHRDLKVM
jgi:serine/threonine protein kinase